VEQDRIARLYLDTCGFLGRFQVGDRDIAFQWLVRQIEANRLGEEILEREIRVDFAPGRSSK
jgi:hypothetical protein